ncbi:MAG: L,D-transpeptidase [Thermoleophilia bacterium]
MRRWWLTGVCAGALCVAVPAGAVPAAEGGALTARVIIPTEALAAPHAGAAPKLRLAGVTRWSGTAQRLLVTDRHRDRRGHEWLKVRLPVRPNGSQGWVRAAAARVTRTTVRFEVDLSARTLEVWDGARRVARWRAGVGRPGTPTPTGRFAIEDPVRTAPDQRSIYGAYTITLTAYSPTLTRFMGGDGLIAIHGAGAGRSRRVGTVSSNGCVILGERALAVAARWARPGTPVTIRP